MTFNVRFRLKDQNDSRKEIYIRKTNDYRTIPQSSFMRENFITVKCTIYLFETVLNLDTETYISHPKH